MSKFQLVAILASKSELAIRELSIGKFQHVGLEFISKSVERILEVCGGAVKYISVNARVDEAGKVQTSLSFQLPALPLASGLVHEWKGCKLV